MDHGPSKLYDRDEGIKEIVVLPTESEMLARNPPDSNNTF